MAFLVIGSGPAGVSCAKALLAQGREVIMIDGGFQLEPSKAEKLVQLSRTPPETWTAQSTEWMRAGMQSSSDGIPLKLAYGSDFPYRTLTGAPVVEGTGVNTRSSLAKGGLSQVWGAAALPIRQHDMALWPITNEDLAPHYKAVEDFMFLGAEKDEIADVFPMFTPSQPMPLSVQASALLNSMNAHRAGLQRKGVIFGRSRLAVDAPRCVRCGLCMYGCPYGLIYTSAQTVDALVEASLRRGSKFTYRPGYIVQQVQESAQGVRLQTQSVHGKPETFEGERAFVGAGVLGTAALMLRSLESYGKPVTMKESHYFLLPMLRLAGVDGFVRSDLHTLAQLFVEVLDESLSPYTIHLQVYTYNDLFESPIRAKLGPLAHIFPWNAFLQRLYLIQGYLHSDHSATTEACLTRGIGGDVLHLKAREHPHTDMILRNLVRKLTGLRRETGMIPLSPLLRRGEPGRGFHTGASFPMVSGKPQGFETDTLGRVAGMQRVHLVDASVLPTIPATTITYTVMANAHRIGTAVGAETFS